MNHDQLQITNCLEINIACVFQPEFQARIRNWLIDVETPHQQKEDFLQALLDFEDDCGGFYRYRAFLLAAEYLALCPECRQGDAIVDRLLKLSYDYFRMEKSDWAMVPGAVAKTAREVLKRTDIARVVPRFETLIRQTKIRSVLHHTRNRLLEIQPGNCCAIVAVICGRLIPPPNAEYHDAQYASQREMQALRSIIGPSVQSDQLVQIISQLAVDSDVVDEFLALQQLIEIAPEHPLTFSRLLSVTARVYDSEVHFYPERVQLQPDVDQLWQKLNRFGSSCFDMLVQLAKTDPQQELIAIRILCDLAPESSIVADVAIGLLTKWIQEERDEPWFDECFFLFDKIARIRVQHDEIKAVLLSILRTICDPEIQYRVAICLKRLDPNQAEATAWILDAIASIESSGFETFLSLSLYIPFQWDLYAMSLAFEDIRPTAIAIWRKAIHEAYEYCSPNLLKAVDCIPETALQKWLTELLLGLETEKDCCGCGSEYILEFLENVDDHQLVAVAIEHFLQWSNDLPSLYQGAKTMLKLDAGNIWALRALRRVITALAEDREDCQTANYNFSSSLFFDAITLLMKEPSHHLFIRQKLLQRLRLGRQATWQVNAIVKLLIAIDQHRSYLLLELLIEKFQQALSDQARHPLLREWHPMPQFEFINWLRASPGVMAEQGLIEVVRILRKRCGDTVDCPYDYAIAWECAQRLPIASFRQAWQK
jgi:hypothetical protein